jgi:hypothetical protein
MNFRTCLRRSLRLIASLSLTGTCLADRHFTFPYESYTEAPGVIESENQVFGLVRRSAGRQTFGLDVHNEIEFGIARDFQLGVYIANWNYRDGRTGDPAGFQFDGGAIEAKYRLLDEHQGKPFGLALLAEVAAGRRFLGLESRLIVDKRFGKWQAVYNVILESEWEDEHLQSRTITLGQSAGLRYDVARNFSAGLETRYEAAFPNHGESTTHAVFVGPVVSYHVERFYITASTQFQATNVLDQPKFFPRVIFGFKF